jgi:VanZ family protein
MAAIFAVSGVPDLTVLPVDVSDKTAHAGAYALLGALALRGFAGAAWAGCTATAAWKAWTLATAYGLSDEWHQSFVPGRTASFGDIAADAAGAAMGALAVLGLRRLWGPPRIILRR